MNRSLTDIRGRYLRLFTELWNAQQDKRLMRLCDLSEKLGKSSSNLLPELDELEKDWCVRRYERGGDVFYGLGLFGEALVELERYPQIMSSLSIIIFWEDCFSEWRRKNGN